MTMEKHHQYISEEMYHDHDVSPIQKMRSFSIVNKS